MTIFDIFHLYFMVYFYYGDDFMVILFIILIFVFIFVLKFLPPSSTPLEEEIIQKNNNEINYKTYYKPKNYITTKKESIFYNVLLEIANELNYTLFAQVPLYAIVGLQDNLDASAKTSYFNKISAKSIDFVLVDDKCRVLLCIELDDNTHKYKNRIERDKFINKLFEDLDIGLLRYPVYPVYYKDTLKKRILEKVNKPEAPHKEKESV